MGQNSTSRRFIAYLLCLALLSQPLQAFAATTSTADTTSTSTSQESLTSEPNGSTQYLEPALPAADTESSSSPSLAPVESSAGTSSLTDLGPADPLAPKVPAVEPTTPPYDPDITPPPAPDETTAAPKLPDKPTEILAKRTASSKTFLNPDGSRTTRAYTGRIHYQDGVALRPIDNSLVPSDKPGFALENKADSHKVRFSNSAANPLLQSLVQIESTQTSLQFGLAQVDAVTLLSSDLDLSGLAGLPDAASPVAKANNVNYKGAYKDTDVRYHLGASVVKEDIVLSKYNGTYKWLFDFDSKNLAPVKQEDGSIVFSNATTGEEAYRLQKPVMYDSATETVSGEPASSAAVDMNIVLVGAKYYLLLQAEPDWLTDSARNYPVYVDPTVTYDYQDGDDTYVSSAYPTQNYVADWDYTNWCFQNKVGKWSSATGENNTLAKFDVSEIEANNAGATVSEANLAMYAYYAATSSPRDVYVDGLDWNGWNPSTVTWNTKPGSINLATVSMAEGQLLANVTGRLQQVADANKLADAGFQLRSNVADPNSWKKFVAMDNWELGAPNGQLPHLDVTYTSKGAQYLADETPKFMLRNTTIKVPVQVANTGTDTWQRSGAGAVSLTYHWYNEDGSAVAGATEVKSPLKENTYSGDTGYFEAAVNVPDLEGRYVLKWDIYQDGVGLYSARGVTTKNYTITLRGGQALLGDQRYNSNHSFAAGDATLKVNAANRNAYAEASDWQAKERGVPFGVTRSYNSQAEEFKSTTGFLREWLVLGPFSGSSASNALNTAYFSTEATFQPRLGRKTAGKNWKAFQSSQDYVDLNRAFGNTTNAAAYAHTYIWSDSATVTNRQLWVGSDDGIKIWLNGAAVGTRDVQRPAVADQDKFANLTLNHGWNHLMIKISQGSGSWGFYARIKSSGWSDVYARKAITKPYFGWQWRSNIDQYLMQVDDNGFIHMDEDGSRQFFSKTFSGSYAFSPGNYSELKANSAYVSGSTDPAKDWKYLLRRPDGTVHFFNAWGRLMRSTDGRHGEDYAAANKLNYNYTVYGTLDSVVTPSGKSYEVRYYSNDLLYEVVDHDAAGAMVHRVVYSYDSDGQLTDVANWRQDLGTTHVGYAYSDFLLTQLIDGRAKPTYLAYTSGDKLRSVRDSRSASASDTTYMSRIDYPEASTISVVDPTAKTIKYEVDSRGNRKKTMLDPLGIAQSTDYTYNGANQMTEVSDAQGTTTYEYDMYGNVTKKVNQLTSGGDSATSSATHTTGSTTRSNTDSETDAAGNKSENSFDAQSNPDSASAAVGNGAYEHRDSLKNVTDTHSLPKSTINLIKNHGFEYDLANWEARVVDQGTASAQSTYKRFGVKGARLDAQFPDNGLADRADLWSDYYTAKPNTVYTRSVYVRGKGRIYAVQYNSNNVRIDTDNENDYVQEIDSGSDWRRLVLSFTTKGNTAKIKIALRANDGDRARFDGVQLEEGSVASAYNLIENGGFEYGSAYWSQFAGTGSLDDHTRRFGTYSYKLHVASANDESKLRQIVHGKAYTDYVVTGWIRNTGNDGNVAPAVVGIDMNNTPNKYSEAPLGGAGWARFSRHVKTDEDGTFYVFIRKFNSSGGDAFFDNVQVVEDATNQTYAYNSSDDYRISDTDSYGNTTYYSQYYDGRLRYKRDARSSGSSDNTYLTDYRYDENDNLNMVIDPFRNNGSANHITYLDHDNNGNLLYQRDARSSSATDNTYKTSYDYTDNNLLSSVTDPLGKTTSYAYDASGRETSVTFPSGTTVGKIYDDAGRLLSVSVNGQPLWNYVYDDSGNVTSVGSEDGSKTWSYTYDAASRLTNSTDPAALGGYQTDFTYDKKNNLLSLTSTIGSNVKAYDYTYNANNWVASAHGFWAVQGTDITSQFYYDDKGNRVAIDNPGSALDTQAEFDQENRVTELRSVKSDSTITSKREYTYDALDNIKTEVLDGTGTANAYTYDKLNRLYTWTGPSGTAVTYNYDEVGNILSGKIGQLGGSLLTKNFTYNAGSQISNLGYTYDDNGNLTNTPDAIYGYDNQDRLSSVTATDTVTSTTQTVSYNYDYLGRRTSKSVGDATTYYHYDESNKDIWRVIGENIIRADGAVEEKLGFAYLPGDYKPFAVKQGSDSYYYQYNAHGDVVALTNENGTTVAQYEYDPWGNPTLIANGSGASVATDPNHIANINPYRYAGYRYDTESGLYYLQARYYDPGTYRFLTKDPDGGDKDDPLSQNPYAYAKGNPVSNVDPDGKYNWWKVGAAAVNGGLAFWNARQAVALLGVPDPTFGTKALAALKGAFAVSRGYRASRQVQYVRAHPKERGSWKDFFWGVAPAPWLFRPMFRRIRMLRPITLYRYQTRGSIAMQPSKVYVV